MHSPVSFAEIREYKEYSFCILFCEAVTETCASQLLVKELEGTTSKLLRVVLKDENAAIPCGAKFVILSPIWRIDTDFDPFVEVHEPSKFLCKCESVGDFMRMREEQASKVDQTPEQLKTVGNELIKKNSFNAAIQVYEAAIPAVRESIKNLNEASSDKQKKELTDLLSILHANASQALNQQKSGSDWIRRSCDHIDEALKTVPSDDHRKKFTYRKAFALAQDQSQAY